MRHTLRPYLALNPSLRAALAAWGLVCFAYFGVAAVLQNLYLLRLGFGVEFIGLLTGVPQLARAVLALPAVLVAQRLGTRGTLIASYTVAGTSYLLFSVVEWLPPGDRPLWLLGSQALLGVGFALNSIGMFPYLIAIAAEPERLHAFAAHRGINAVATLIGSLAAGALPGWLATFTDPGDAAAPYRAAMPLVVLAHYLAAATMLKARPAPAAAAPPPESPDARSPATLFLGLGALSLLTVTGEGAARTFFNVFMDRGLGAGAVEIGLVLGITALLGVAIAFGVPPLMARLGTGRSIAVGLGGVALGLVLLAFAPYWQMASAGYALVIGVGTFMGTARNLFAQELVPAHARTSAAAIHSIGVAVGLAGAAAAGGYLIGSVGFAGMFLAAAFVSLLSVPLVARFVARHPPHLAPAPG